MNRDNPKSDIRGANAMGDRVSSWWFSFGFARHTQRVAFQWRSILVRTGCFHAAAANDADDPAWRVCDDVVAAIDLVFQTESSAKL